MKASKIKEKSIEDLFYDKFIELGGNLDRQGYDYYRKCMEAILDRWIGGYAPYCDRDFTWGCFVHVCASDNTKDYEELAGLIFKSVDTVVGFS